MQYNKKIIDHVENPRNVGSMDENDPNVGVGLVGAPACGDVMKFYVRIENDKIIDSKFKTFGCGSAIASSSLLTEKVLGKTLIEAEEVKNKDIYDELELPPIKFHCSVLAEDAIKAAIEDYKRKNVR
jgi:nitrogen fixation protein NifU and related proteins